jgi:hypothetical protein
MGAPLVPVLHQMRPVHTHFFEIRFNNIVTSALASHVVFCLSSRLKTLYAFSISLMPEQAFTLKLANVREQYRFLPYE